MIYGTYPRDIDVEKAIRVIDEMTIQEMVDAGFRGIPRVSSSCPVAHGLQKMLHWEWVYVGIGTLGTLYGEDCNDEDTYDLPETLISFIRGFDAGHCPELEQQL